MVDVVVGGADGCGDGGLAAQHVIRIGEDHRVGEAVEGLGGGGEVAKDRVGVVEVVLAVADGGYASGVIIGRRIGLADVLGDVRIGKVIVPFFGGLAGERIVGIVGDAAVAIYLAGEVAAGVIGIGAGFGLGVGSRPLSLLLVRLSKINRRV